jgi:hypothetical protein
MNSSIRSKMKWLILPAQSGKTRKVEDKIALANELNHRFNAGKNPELNIWISANNKLLVQQTATRFKKDLGQTDDESHEICDASIRGHIFSWMSGNKNTTIKVEDLASRTTTTIERMRIDMIVMCANKSRIKYLSALLKHIGDQRRISIWIDEADRTVNLWSEYTVEFLTHVGVRQMTLVSATFNAVREKVGDVEVLPYSETTPDCYRGLGHCNVIQNNGPNSAVDYVDMILEKHKSTLAVPGMRAFIPGNNTKSSHEQISNLLLTKFGFAVLIINGAHKEIRLPTGDKIELREFLSVKYDETPIEFNTILATKYDELNLNRYPLAITGYMCVERGVTFQTVSIDGLHDGFLFDYAIISPISDPAEAYQTMARVFGNTGHSPHYKAVDIYTNTTTYSRVVREEKIAMNIAKIAEKYNAKSISDLEIALACEEAIPNETRPEDFIQEWTTVPLADAQTHHDPKIRDYVNNIIQNNVKGSITYPDKFKPYIEKGILLSSWDVLARVNSYTDGFNLQGRSPISNTHFVADDTWEVGKPDYRHLIVYHDINDPASGLVMTRVTTRKYNPKSLEDRVKERHIKPATGNPF